MEISITLTDEQVSDYIQRIEYVPYLTEEEQMIFDAIVEKFQQLQKERKTLSRNFNNYKRSEK